MNAREDFIISTTLWQNFWRCVTEIIGNDISQDVISTLANNLNHVFPYYPASNQDFTYVELYGQERMLLSNS